MAYRNKIITNPRTGQTIKFLNTAADTNGKFLEMESSFIAGSKEPPPHYHPNQEENFTILIGQLTIRINEKSRVYSAGESLRIPKNTIHSMWNQSDKPTLVKWHVSPAMNTENFLETTMGLASDGKTNKDGMPNILQIALIANKYNSIFRLSRPPFILQKIIFSILTPFAYLFGYKAFYSKYFN